MRTTRPTNHTLASVTLLLLALAMLIAVPSANASGDVSSTSGAITYSAGGGDGANDVTVDHNGLAYVITDSVTLNAGSGCNQVDAKTVSCPGIYGKQTTLNLGDGLDQANVTGSVPSTGRVTINGDAGGTNVDAGGATAAIAVNSTLGNYFSTGAGADVLNLGGPGFTAQIFTGASADSLTFTTDLPKATYDPDTEDVPYPYGTAYLNESWPVYVHTDAGNDYIDGSASTGAFWYEAAGGCDLILGGSGSDWFNGGGTGTDDDTILAGGGDDTIYSYPTNDGEDMYYGQAGNDKLFEWNNPSKEMFDGGVGTDMIYYQSGSASSTGSVTLDGLRNDGIVGNDIWTNTERVVGAMSIVGETLTGNVDDNILTGYVGDDTITGGPGNDTLNGLAGNDSIDSVDGQPDTVNCGDGTGDVANFDAGIDTVSNCETLIPH